MKGGGGGGGAQNGQKNAVTPNRVESGEIFQTSFYFYFVLQFYWQNDKILSSKTIMAKQRLKSQIIKTKKKLFMSRL